MPSPGRFSGPRGGSSSLTVWGPQHPVDQGGPRPAGSGRPGPRLRAASRPQAPGWSGREWFCRLNVCVLEQRHVLDLMKCRCCRKSKTLTPNQEGGNRPVRRSQGAIRKEGLVQGGGPRGLFCLFHPALRRPRRRPTLGRNRRSECGNAGSPEKPRTFQGKAPRQSHLGSGSQWREVAQGGAQ